MKKLFLFAAVITAVSLVSCKKDHTCTCTTTFTGGGTTLTTTEVVTYTKSTKHDARQNCISYTETDASGTTTRTCTLK